MSARAGDKQQPRCNGRRRPTGRALQHLATCRQGELYAAGQKAAGISLATQPRHLVHRGVRHRTAGALLRPAHPNPQKGQTLPDRSLCYLTGHFVC